MILEILIDMNGNDGGNEQTNKDINNKLYNYINLSLQPNIICDELYLCKFWDNNIKSTRRLPNLSKMFVN